MTDSTRPQLVGYLLQALETEEAQQVADQLRQDVELRRECLSLQRGLQILAPDEEPYDPPEYLARRTCTKLWAQPPAITASAASNASESTAATKSPGDQSAAGQLALSGIPATSTPLTAGITAATLNFDSSRAGTPTVERAAPPEQLPVQRRWHSYDVIASACMLMALGGVLLPTMLQSRDQARTAGCQSNLKDLYFSLAGFTTANNGRLPTADERGRLAFAGVFAPKLAAAGQMENPRILICPESNLAQDPSFRVSSLNELNRAKPSELVLMQRTVGGSYGFTLGYREQGVYRPVMNLQRKTFALAGDLPRRRSADGSLKLSKLRGGSHGGDGFNILFEDGHISYIIECRDANCQDDYYFNDENQAAAGLHQHDAVLVESGQAP